MSDFDSAVEKATRLFGGMSQHDHDIAAIFYSSAITSMQGEASEPSGYTDVETINRWHRLRGTDYEVVERGYLPFSSKPFKTDDTDCTTAVWLSPPPSTASKIAEQDARIKELEQQLSAARKDAERYRLLRDADLTVYGTPRIAVANSEWSGTYMNGDDADSAIDAAILQIGGAE